VVLTDAINVTDSTIAATATAAKAAYDRGSTGITNAASAQTTADAAVPKSRTVTGAFPITVNTVSGSAIDLTADITLGVRDASSTTSGVTQVITAMDTASPYPLSAAGINSYVSGLSYISASTLSRVLYGATGAYATHTREALTTTNTNVSGTLTLTRFYPLQTFTCTNISITSGAVVSSGLTYCAFGIYTRSGSTFTRVRITSSDTTIFNTANTKYTRALTSTSSLTGSTEYFIGVLQVGTVAATTLGAIARTDTAANAATGTQVYTVTGQTTLGTALTGTANATRADFAEVS